MFYYRFIIISLAVSLAWLCPSDIYGQSCTELPETFVSTTRASEIVKKTKFLYIDRITTERSSWIKSATYYSCDRKTGFFLLVTNKGNEYLFQEMPVNVWERFKQAKSYGEFYNQYIKSKYRLKIRQL